MICLRFQVVAAAWAARLASRTAETKPAAGTERMLATMAAGIACRNRRLQHEVAMLLVLIAGHRDVIRAAP
jgi:hypothetical protein